MKETLKERQKRKNDWIGYALSKNRVGDIDKLIKEAGEMFEKANPKKKGRT